MRCAKAGLGTSQRKVSHLRPDAFVPSRQNHRPRDSSRRTDGAYPFSANSRHVARPNAARAAVIIGPASADQAAPATSPQADFCAAWRSGPNSYLCPLMRPESVGALAQPTDHLRPKVAVRLTGNGQANMADREIDRFTIC